VDLELRRLPRPPAQSHPGIFSSLSLRAAGDGGTVLTKLRLGLTTPVHRKLEPWQLPTHLTRGPLSSFAALRQPAVLLDQTQAWKNLNVGEPPQQLYFWSEGTNAFQTYFAAPWPEAARKVDAIAQVLLDKVNPWLATRGLVSFERVPGLNAVAWGNLAAIRPFLQSVDQPAPWVLGGLLPKTEPATENAIPHETVTKLTTATNLIGYFWENSGARMDRLLGVGDFLRLISRRPSFPLESASGNWLRVITARLGPTETVASLTAPDEVLIERKGTVGFSAAELQFLADWMESPQFPKGLHSTAAPSVAPHSSQP
jgi:hypothetical protein